jgi:hypothetical protein
MRMSYEIRAGQRIVSHQAGSTAQEALLDYLRSLGCRDEEIMRVAVDAVSWRGALYRAVATTPEPLALHAS